MSKVLIAWNWLVETIRSGAPVLICVFGAMVLSTGRDAGWVAILIAMLCFVWALDLAATRASAKARLEAANEIIRFLADGRDSTITIEVLRRRGEAA